MKRNFEAFKPGHLPENFFGFRSTHENSISLLQNHSSFKQLCEIVDGNSALINQHYFQRFYGNPLPNSYRALGKLEKRFWPFYANSLISAINWTTLSVRAHKWHISLFVEYRKLFEHSFLIGDYVTADRYLTKIENEVCHSIWTLENRLLLLEFKESPEFNKTFLSEVNSVSDGLYTASLSHYFSARAEKNLAVSRFDSDLNAALQKIKGDGAASNKELYCLRLNRFENDNYSNLKDVLIFDSHNSIIDRYILLVQVLKMCLSAENVDTATRFIAGERIAYLSTKFQDPEFGSLTAVLSPDQIPIFKSDLDIELLDMFASGLYSECIERLSVRIVEAPSIIEYYSLYVRCFLYSKTRFKLPTPKACHQNWILEAMYQLLARTIDPNEASINLQRLLKNLHSFYLAYGLHKFINDEIDFNPKWRSFDYLALASNNPEISGFFRDVGNAHRYLNQLHQKYEKSLAIKFKLISIHSDYENLLGTINVPQIIKKIERGKLCHKSGNYSEAVAIWLELLNDRNDIVPIYELALEYLFKAYVETSEFDKAISLYVETYMRSSFLVSRIDVSLLHTKIRERKFRNVKASIDLPLFYTFTNLNENEIHITYERFLSSFNVKRPSQLQPFVFEQETNKWILFLRLTCSTEIFKHSIYIDGSKDGFSERINICQILLFLDKENEENYKYEIKELSDGLIIQEGLQQLDESKIYVNESGLINFELKEFEGLFNRYRTIANIYKSSDKKLLVFDHRSNDVRLASMDDVKNALTKDRYSSDPLRDAFADIFDVITRKFLFSKFGISAYLSTRIRHGVLLGELRPIFEKHNLISQKDSITRQYRTIDHWNKVYHHLASDVKTIQSSLAKFSHQIDSIILGLLKDSLQIRTDDENEEGWFDYYFDDTELSLQAIAARDTKDFSEFVRRTIEILWLRTDKNLSEIRYKIQNEVKNKFNQAIETLTSDLQNSILHSESQIFTNINTCLTDTDNTLTRISSWFNRSGSQTSDFKLDKLIHIVLENISHSYPNRKLRITKFEVTDVTIKGEFYMHFADLFRIFFDNALKHSDQTVERIDAEIVSERQDRQLSIMINNTNCNTQDFKELSEQSNSEASMRKLSTEGKSGFPKAYKIIRSDLKNESNSYKCHVDEQGRFTVQLLIYLDNLIA